MSGRRTAVEAVGRRPTASVRRWVEGPDGAGVTYGRPVRLLERDRELAVMGETLSEAVAGSGLGVAVSAEPGGGKTALVEAAYADPSPVRVLRGACDPLATPRPLGPFRDIAAAAGIAELRTSEVLLLSQVCEAVYDALREVPTVLVVEDLHWVDAASVEVLRFLARRLGAMPLSLVVTYRDDEVGPGHSARPLLGDFAGLERLTTLRLEPLSSAAVASLLEGTPLVAEQVHALTAGNPFFVTEVAKDPGRPLPASVRDAVLARTAAMAPEDFEVLQLAAAAPGRLDDRLLPALHVDLPTLRRLHDTGLMQRDRGGLLFRHELARLAVESTIPAGGTARLHARLLDALERLEPHDPAVLTHHAVAAQDAARAGRHAREAAQEAARAGSHTEAAAFLQIALDHLEAGQPRERASLLSQLAYEQYMTNRLAPAIDNVLSTVPLWQQAGDADGLSTAYESCAIFEYYNARRRHAEAHVERAASVAGDASEPTYGAAVATRGYLALHRGDYQQVLECSAGSGRIARDHDRDDLAVRSELYRRLAGLALEEPGAREAVLDQIEVARAHGLDEVASSGYSNVTSLDVEQRRLRAAEHLLEESLRFSAERDIPICRLWQTGVRARLRFLLGHWEAALEDAADVLADAGMPLAVFWPHVVTGLLAVRRGAPDDGHLDAAWDLALQLQEPMRRLAALAALAERMWLTGEEDARVVDGVSWLVEVAGAPGSAWAVGDLALWLRRLGLLPSGSWAGVAEPYRLSLEGRHEDAAETWHGIGAAYEQATAGADSTDAARRARAVERLDLLGAVATADRHRHEMRKAGYAAVPQRPHGSTRANPGGLTNRQLDVAKLVARGFTNSEVAGRLFISPKTADHHVSAVLAKLGVRNRRALVVSADELGLS